MTVDSKNQLLGLVNQDNALTLTENDVIFGSVADDSAGRSIARITAVKGSGYRGGVTLRYRRLSLSSLFGFFNPKIQVENGVNPTVDWLTSKVFELYGVELNPNETVISRVHREDGDYYLVEAKDNSFYYSDQASFRLVFTQVDITTVVGEDTTNYVYPSPQDTPAAIDGLVYSGGWLIPEAADELSEFLTGQYADDNLMWLTQTLSGDDWFNDSSNPQEYNLAQALVAYNGPVSSYSVIAADAVSLLKVPTGATKVLVLTLDSTLCTNFVGAFTYFY